MPTFHSMQLQYQYTNSSPMKKDLMVCVPSSGWVNSTWQYLQCGLWVGVDYRVADRRDSREFADREVAGKMARGIRWNYAGEDRLLGCADGDMLGCEDGRRSAAERLSSSQSVRSPTSPHSAFSFCISTATVESTPTDSAAVPRPTHTLPFIYLRRSHLHVVSSHWVTILATETATRWATETNRAARKPVTIAGTCESRSLRRVNTLHHSPGDGSASAGQWTGCFPRFTDLATILEPEPLAVAEEL
jgi:hypothetical protein